MHGALHDEDRALGELRVAIYKYSEMESVPHVFPDFVEFTRRIFPNITQYIQQKANAWVAQQSLSGAVV